MLTLLPGLYLDWGIGANDAANTSGPQVGANVISFRRAIVLAQLNLEMSVISTLAAAITVNVLTYFGMPISTSHSIVGALVAVGLIQRTGVNTVIVLKVAATMVTAPVGACVTAYTPSPPISSPSSASRCPSRRRSLDRWSAWA